MSRVTSGPSTLTASLRWIELDAGDADRQPGSVEDILSRRLDGMTISGVFTAAEADNAVGVLDHRREDRVPAMFGTMLGLPLAESARAPDPSDRTTYLDETERCTTIYREAFGGDPFDRVADVVSALAGDLSVGVPTENGRRYNPGNIRWYEPGSAGLPAHVGNEFHMHGEGALSHLRTTTVTRDFLSWFVILQAPEAGGALSVYDRLFESHTPAQVDWTEHGRDDADFEDIPALRIAPEPGTLVLFGGGWRWHRVDPIGGGRARVTYGGFAGRSIDGRALHFWF